MRDLPVDSVVVEVTHLITGWMETEFALFFPFLFLRLVSLSSLYHFHR